MKIIKKATIVDPNSKWNGKQADVLIADGVIAEIAENISTEADQTVEEDNLHVSPGWFDLHVNFCDPGEEYKEDLISGADAAAAEEIHSMRD